MYSVENEIEKITPRYKCTVQKGAEGGLFMLAKEIVQHDDVTGICMPGIATHNKRNVSTTVLHSSGQKTVSGQIHQWNEPAAYSTWVYSKTTS